MSAFIYNQNAYSETASYTPIKKLMSYIIKIMIHNTVNYFSLKSDCTFKHNAYIF
jgi:hypothetical protein